MIFKKARATIKNIRQFTVLSSCILFGCNCINKNASEQKPIHISFVVDGKPQNISNTFKIYFVAKKDTLEGISNGNLLKLPKLSNDTVFDVIFKLKQYSLNFGQLSKQAIISNQEIEWRFGIDNKPFDRTSSILSDNEYNINATAKQLIYLQMDPMESGDGIQLTKWVY